VVEVVVGLPRSLSGDEGASARAARAYAVVIARRVAPVPVRLVDERLSTVAAHQHLREAGVKGRRQRPVVDQAAAVVILQSALDFERASERPPGSLVETGDAPADDCPARGRPAGGTSLMSEMSLSDVVLRHQEPPQEGGRRSARRRQERRQKRRRRRAFLAVILSVVIVGGAVGSPGWACGRSSTASPSPTTTPATAAATSR
jgi:hypothetical protein